jgi:hypothetical protein
VAPAREPPGAAAVADEVGIGQIAPRCAPAHTGVCWWYAEDHGNAG